MHKSLAIFFAITVAALCSQPVMSALQYLVVPLGQRVSVISPGDAFAAQALFTLSLCACAGLAAAVGCYLRRYSIAGRWAAVLLPMLAAGSSVTLLKAAQFRQAQSAAAALGIPPAFSLQQASLHLIPAAAVVAGLVAVGVTMFLRPRNGRPCAGLNGGPATRLGNSGHQGQPPVS